MIVFKHKGSDVEVDANGLLLHSYNDKACTLIRIIPPEEVDPEYPYLVESMANIRFEDGKETTAFLDEIVVKD